MTQGRGYIAEQLMTAEAAARKGLDQHGEVWRRWMPR